MSIGGTYYGITANMLAKRFNSFGSILCGLDLRGFASHGFGGILGVEWKCFHLILIVV